MSEEPASEGGEVDPTAGVADLAERVDALADAVEALEADVDEKIEDVRARVIQVKREADAKAPADHDHPEMTADVERAGELEDDLADLRAEQERIAETVKALDDRLEAGFANYEEVLEYLFDTADTMEARIERIVDAVTTLREQANRLEAGRTERAAADRLKARAQREGVASAKCGDCGGGVQLGLLTAARCPHCEASFADVESRGFLRSAVVRTGSRPALEGPGRTDDAALDDLAVESDRARPTVEDLSVPDEPERAVGDPVGDEPGDSEPGSAARTDQGSGQPVEAVPGIGAAYAERLGDAGVETVDDLASADPDQVAGASEIASGRVETWIERARELDRPG